MSSLAIKKPQTLTLLTLPEYFITILTTLKSIAFHELYMQNQRQQLCRNQFYDPLTAFQTIDIIRHNKIVAFQLKSFLDRQHQNQKVKVTFSECQEVLEAINKGIFALCYEDFQQLTLPQNQQLRTLSKKRYENLQPQPGTHSKVYQIKSTSQKKISQFFMKQIQFYRQLLIRKQNFCTKYGGDVYTLKQSLCKDKTINNKINYKQLAQFARAYKIYFNMEEFKGLYRRTKNCAVYQTGFYENCDKLQIELQNLVTCLLASTKNLDIKNKLRITTNQTFTYPTQPSYKTTNIWTRQKNLKEEQKYNQKQQQFKQLQQGNQKDKRDIRYKYYFPQMGMYQPASYHRKELNFMEEKWRDQVDRMGNQEINIRYGLIDRKKYFL